MVTSFLVMAPFLWLLFSPRPDQCNLDQSSMICQQYIVNLIKIVGLGTICGIILSNIILAMAFRLFSVKKKFEVILVGDVIFILFILSGAMTEFFTSALIIGLLFLISFSSSYYIISFKK